MMIIEQDLYENVEKYTGDNYEGNFKEEGWLNTREPNYLVSDDSIQSMLQDLVWEVMHWKEKYEDLKENVNENYTMKPFDPYEEYGISESEFH